MNICFHPKSVPELLRTGFDSHKGQHSCIEKDRRDAVLSGILYWRSERLNAQYKVMHTAA